MATLRMGRRFIGGGGNCMRRSLGPYCIYIKSHGVYDCHELDEQKDTMLLPYVR